MLQLIKTILLNYIRDVRIPSIRWTDIFEILIIAFLIYQVMNWFRNSRAWSLLKGIVVIGIFIIFAVLFNMTTILWIFRNVTGIAVTALVVILQPELRSAMEELGQRAWFASIFRIGEQGESMFSDRTISELVRATQEMAKVKTGALIVIAQNTPLKEYAKTGIEVDAVVSSQLLINIFEKNTPLHDGAVIIYGNRVEAATCYLPLSHNKMDKELGTRHRAGVGISEETDSFTIIVSEETGAISTAYRGELSRAVNAAELREKLSALQESMGQNRDRKEEETDEEIQN